ncbi:AMP-binding enzyme [Actinomadura decatromicini]|uniref:AMP-binding enzyme n=1 Tax=Actinomadura decatromicini TaxID=2604572 RepID=UPI001CA3326D|nr:hypothetical protein [Actinomadura decatromicini]
MTVFATAGIEGGVRGAIGGAPAEGWEDVDICWTSGPETAPDVLVEDDDPLRLYELDGVAEVAVFGIGHLRWIEAVTAVVVPKPGTFLTADDVHAHTRARLAGYKRPKYIGFAEALPKKPSGKILKRTLRTEHAHFAQAES